MKPTRIVLSGFFLLFAIACGSTSSSNPDDGGLASSGDGSSGGGGGGDGGGARGDSGSSDAPSDVNLNGTYACGGNTCQTGEYCVHPCSGGVLPLCTPKTDAGTCPNGTVSGMCMDDGGPNNVGCVPAPPPPFCSQKPECPGGPAGSFPHGRDVDCVCA